MFIFLADAVTRWLLRQSRKRTARSLAQAEAAHRRLNTDLDRERRILRLLAGD